MSYKIGDVNEVRKVRKALRVQYSKFVKDFNLLGRRFHKLVEDSDLLLGAMEEIIKLR